jgi:hypothetical protein
MIFAPFFSFPNSVEKVSRCTQLHFGDPLLQEGGTIPKLDTFALAASKKSYNVSIDEHHFHKIEDCTLAFLTDQLLDRTHVFDLDSPVHTQHDFAITTSEPLDLTGH